MSEDFRAAYKRLKKRHKSLEQDFEQLLASLLQNPMQGVELDGGARKVRLAITSKGRGKSGGARVIIRVRIVRDELQLLYIYDKSDFENISDAYLRDVLKLPPLTPTLSLITNNKITTPYSCPATSTYPTLPTPPGP